MTREERIVQDILVEREKQSEKWGEQNHSDGDWSLIAGEEFGEACQAALHTKFGGKASGTTRAELVQLAAVIVQWVDCIDRRLEGR